MPPVNYNGESKHCIIILWDKGWKVMSKFTKKAIMHEFMKILEEKSLDKITVKDICERSEINRNTFYYYFDNVDDVLYSIFEIEKKQMLEDVEESDSFLEEYKKTASFVVNNKKAVINIYQSKNGDILLNYFDAVTMDFVKRAVKKAAEGYRISEENINYISHFYTNAICGTTMKWIERGMPPYKEDFLEKISKSYEVTIRDLLEMFDGK